MKYSIGASPFIGYVWSKSIMIRSRNTQCFWWTYTFRDLGRFCWYNWHWVWQGFLFSSSDLIVSRHSWGPNTFSPTGYAWKRRLVVRCVSRHIKSSRHLEDRKAFLLTIISMITSHIHISLQHTKSAVLSEPAISNTRTSLTLNSKIQAGDTGTNS